MQGDLTILGKVIGGGLPAAAVGGRAELMRLLAPAGEVYQAGTLSGNPARGRGRASRRSSCSTSRPTCASRRSPTSSPRACARPPPRQGVPSRSRASPAS